MSDHLKTRIEVASDGEFYITLPTEMVEDLDLEDGEVVYVYVKDGMAELYFG